jgi:hypothetical protein
MERDTDDEPRPVKPVVTEEEGQDIWNEIYGEGRK